MKEFASGIAFGCDPTGRSIDFGHPASSIQYRASTRNNEALSKN
jgi:hypothetical protein